MANANGSVRERKAKGAEGKDAIKHDVTTTTIAADENKPLSTLDILRILLGLLLLNSLLSYFITSDSFLWGYRPWFVRPQEVMRYFVSPSTLFV